MKAKKIFRGKNNPPRAVIFMSGSGTNAEKLLESLSECSCPSWMPSAILTDMPERSRAREISRRYGIPLIEHDIRKFYFDRGEEKVSLLTEKGKKIREEWTEEMRTFIRSFAVDFGIFAGFIPLSNICEDFPCLNVHPGDLTTEENGRRLLVGLHTIPIETAIIRGFSSIRSSVIIAQPYTGKGDEMDSGPILGISPEVKIDLMGYELEELSRIYAARPGRRPAGGFKDILEEIAGKNQNNLKMFGDWVVFPKTVHDFAAGVFWSSADGTLFYREGGKLLKIKTVVYDDKGKTLIRLI
jgi:folate-dependent phosphoribosylglycinamide formyltransferase PurN